MISSSESVLLEDVDESLLKTDLFAFDDAVCALSAVKLEDGEERGVFSSCMAGILGSLP